MLRTIVTAFLALWLPLQGTAAVAMPFCDHTLGGNTQAMPQPDRSHHQGSASGALATHEHGAAAAHDGRTGPASANLACNDCGVCHLACAPAAPAAGFVFAMPVLSAPLATDVALLAPFEPEQPQPPPLIDLL
ncbi:MAG TPA: hypothetical protein VMH32_22935 [Burkholderiales bacterium]|nr:hypothetical protein [Burkholderiales bacterium]